VTTIFLDLHFCFVVAVTVYNDTLLMGGLVMGEETHWIVSVVPFVPRFLKGGDSSRVLNWHFVVPFTPSFFRISPFVFMMEEKLK